MDPSRLTVGEAIAGIGGLALFLFMFVGWFDVDLVEIQVPGGPEVTGVGKTIDGWGAFGFPIDVLLFAAAVAAIAQAILRATGNEAPWRGEILLAAGAFATLLVLYRVIDPPNAVDVSRKLGLYLSLLSALAIALGAYIALSEAPIAAARERRRPLR
jgi:hypothetical protein